MTDITLVLERHEVGQILDGLEQRAIAYERTVACWNGEYIPAGVVIEEVNNAGEAESIAKFYRDIIGKILKQHKEQGA